MRTKEDAHDYRYFEDPDLVPIIIGDVYLSHFYEKVIECGTDSKTACNWILGDVLRILKEKGLPQISSVEVLDKIIDDVLSKNSKSVEDYKNGKKQAVGYLVGQVIKSTQGKANPKLASDIIKSKISK